MTTSFDSYRELEAKLAHVRWLNRGLDSAEEEALLEQMEEQWYLMTADERSSVDATPATSLIRPASPQRARLLEDRDVLADPSGPVRTHVEAA